MRDPSTLEIDTTPDYSEHEAGTEQVIMLNKGLFHREGGWPRDVDIEDPDAKERFRKKFEKGIPDKDGSGGTQPLGENVKGLGPLVDRALKQNNTIDIYEEYFDGEEEEHSSEPPSAKGLAKFRDPNSTKRTATSINWNPDSPEKIAVSYSIMSFQDPRFMNERLPVDSYIWNLNNPNTPEQTLTPSSPLCCLRYNKNSDFLIGGSYNGLISYFDARAGPKPVEVSAIETSHHDPVYDIFWTQSKGGNLAVSCSTDGQVLWWDTRRLAEPVDKIMLDDGTGTILGGSSLAYNAEAGSTKYLIGSEQGCVIGINTRNKKTNNGVTVFDRGTGKHHAPIYSIERNPIIPSFFMTVGDWTARIWEQDTKTPIMTTVYSPSYLTSGCWSTTRPGVFFTTRMDGVLDVWDYYYTQSHVAYTHKVSEDGLSSITVQDEGKLCAVGDVAGTVSLLELCDSLAKPHDSEKQALTSMLTREYKREKQLESRYKEIARRNAKKGGAPVDKDKDKKDEKMIEVLRQVDADFLAMVRESEDADDGGADLEEAK